MMRKSDAGKAAAGVPGGLALAANALAQASDYFSSFGLRSSGAAAIRAHNGGVDGTERRIRALTSRGIQPFDISLQDLDSGTAGGNYVSHVSNLMDCFH